MAIYKNTNQNSAITSVEFTPVPKGNSTFLHLKAGADVQGVKQWLADIGQQITAETPIGNESVLVTRGDKTQADIIKSLKEHDGNLKLPPEAKKGVNLWKARGILSMIGHPMQLISGAMAKGGMDTATIGFASLNLMANLTNIAFGAEKKTDPHHLHFIKEKVNTLLTPYVPEGTKLPDPNTLAPTRTEPEKPKTTWQKFHGFMKGHSVMLGEIGLRYIGGLSLIFSIVKLKKVDGKTKQSVAHWAEGAGKLANGEFKAAWNAVKNPDTFTRIAGTGWIMGKNIAFLSKVPDPYDPDKPKPGSTKDKINKFREKHTFKISTFTEALGASTMAYDRFFRRTITIPEKITQKEVKTVLGDVVKIPHKSSRLWNFVPEHLPNWKIIPEKLPSFNFLPKGFFKKWAANEQPLIGEHIPNMKLRGMKLRGVPIPDFIGGIGASLFALAFVMRFKAPFGVRQVNMDEVDAHVADALAKVPADKLPQAVAETSAYLVTHFKDKKLEFGKVYTQLADDLYHYHNIALPDSVGISDRSSQIADVASEPGKTFAKPELKKVDPASMPRMGSFQDRTAATQGETLQRA